MKSIFSLFLIALLVVAMPGASAAVDIDQDVTIEVVDQLEVETAFQTNQVETADIVIDVGFEDSGIVTGVGEDDHQVFTAEFRQYEQLITFAKTSDSTLKGYGNRIHSPPLKIIS